MVDDFMELQNKHYQYVPVLNIVVLLFHIPVPAPLIVVILSLYSPLVGSIGQ